MYEKVSKNHPDKLADRIAGALVDLAYSINENPKVAIEVLIGHKKALIINETDTSLNIDTVKGIVYRILKTSDVEVEYKEVPQDSELAKNQKEEIRCGDNGIFKGVPTNKEENTLADFTYMFDNRFDSDGKYILDLTDKTLITCQSNAAEREIEEIIKSFFIDRNLDLNEFKFVINPLGRWTGGTNVDCGATNRKLGSDMGRACTGGGLHGKDLSKADVSVNILCHLIAQEQQGYVFAKCAIGDTNVDITLCTEESTETRSYSYEQIVSIAREYIEKCGGFEKFAEYGLVTYNTRLIYIE